jgi:hypothetical protein
MQRVARFVLATIVSFGLAALSAASAGAAGETKCVMKFSMKGWSVFYKTSTGEGTITCDNGETAAVTISLTGGGITFGKTEFKDAIGTFSPVSKLENILGSYGSAEAEAGAVKSRAAQALTKGEVSLAITGTGEGWNLGVSGSKFTIARKK